MPLPSETMGSISKSVTEEADLDDYYDLLFITNPTDLHYRTLASLGGIARAIFVEKPVFNDPRLDIDSLNLRPDGLYYVACPLRYTGVVETLKRTIHRERILSVRAICSSYLPDWRPTDDYRNSYSASAARGGGVRIDLIHEWDYLNWLFGKPKELLSMAGRFSELEIDSEDLAIYIARYQGFLAELHLDYFGRKPRRSVEIFTDAGVIEADILRGIIKRTDETEPIIFHENANDKYLREMKYFLHLFDAGGLSQNDIQSAVSTLLIACCDYR
jgi:predicted dehydrogenase